MNEDREAREISFEHILRKACRAINPKNVLEWGPGRSTRMIAEECPGAKIFSIEHEKKWINKFNEDPLPNVEIVYSPIDLKGGTSSGYVTDPLYRYYTDDSFPLFDLIFIDGRFRFDCIVVSKQLLDPEGCVIVHDSHRKNYRKAFEIYENVKDFPELRTTLLSEIDPDHFDDEKETWWSAISRESTLKRIKDHVSRCWPFYHVRFGDGELYCTEDPTFQNKRHQPKDGNLSRELRESLQIDDPRYQIAATMAGWNPGKLRGLRRILSQYFREKKFYHVTFLHETFLNDFDAFVKFTELFQSKKVLLIGGPTVCASRNVINAFNIKHIIPLSDTNAYDMLDKNMDYIVNDITHYDIVISALGWASTVLAKRLWNLGINKIQFLDVGSVVDALAGVNTRGWIRKNWEYVLEKRKYFA